LRSLPRGGVYYAFLIESQAFFAYSFQNLSLPVQCPSRFALACSRSVEAHYRESEKSGKCFLKNNFQLIIFYTSQAFFHQKTPFLTIFA
ncbi:TPA: hypothetical protein ACS778_002451, partial [Providencia alcalifaciens]